MFDPQQVVGHATSTPTPNPNPKLQTLAGAQCSRARISEGYATKFAPHKAPKLIAAGTLTFDGRFVVHRVVHKAAARGGVRSSLGSGFVVYGSGIRVQDLGFTGVPRP